jgi:hypothetical protein
MIEKDESRRIRKAIRHVLLTEWDPIGVGHIPACADEYDSYIGDVYSILIDGSNDDAVAQYLWTVANDRMGLTIPKEAMMPTVVALRGAFNSATQL